MTTFAKALCFALLLPPVLATHPFRSPSLLQSICATPRINNNNNNNNSKNDKDNRNRIHVTLLTQIRGGSVDLEMASEAFAWCSNLGAPAALVAGAVLVTLGETREEMAPMRKDTAKVRRFKQLQRFLLLSAFALETISIFATTVTGTMLLTQGDHPTGNLGGEEYHSPMGFLQHNHEFEYLTARITFIQGLLNWLAASAIEIEIPKHSEGEAARRMNAFISSSLVTMILLMLSFYNAHMSYYHNYAHMVWVYMQLCWHRYLWTWPIRPLAYLYIPSLLLTTALAYRAFVSPSKLDVDE